MVEKQFQQGETIIREGDFGDSFFQIVNGSVSVLTGEGTADEKLLTELHAGDYFGELAVIEGYNRTATVRAGEDGATVCEIQGSELPELFEKQPGKILSLMSCMSGRIRSLTLDYDEVSEVLNKMKSGDIPKEDEGFMASLRRFIQDGKRRGAKAVSEETLRKIHSGHDTGYVKRVNSFPAGTVIFREGDPGDCMFDIHFGSVGIYTGYGTPDEVLLTELGVNRFFGEMGLIDKVPRSATAVTMQDGTTLETIYEEDLEELFKKNPPKAGMILQHLAIRYKLLSDDYLKACKEVAAAAE